MSTKVNPTTQGEPNVEPFNSLAASVHMFGSNTSVSYTHLTLPTKA